MIAGALDRIATLWQIPNWTANNSVLLAEWTYETYLYEPLEVIVNCLKNPPVSEDKVYRLTPDVVTAWMTAELEREAVKRERDLQQFKSDFKEPIDKIDYESFKKRTNGILPDVKPKHWKDDPKYQEFKAERTRQALQKVLDGKASNGLPASQNEKDNGERGAENLPVPVRDLQQVPVSKEKAT